MIADSLRCRYRATLEYLLDNGLLEPNALVLADNALCVHPSCSW